MNEKICRNCSKFPCERKECDIFSKKACEVFESTVSATAKEMNLVSKDGENYKFDYIEED